MTDVTPGRQRPPAFPQVLIDDVKNTPAVARGRDAFADSLARGRASPAYQLLVLVEQVQDVSSLIAAGRAHEARPGLDAIAEGMKKLAGELHRTTSSSDISDTSYP